MADNHDPAPAKLPTPVAFGRDSKFQKLVLRRAEAGRSISGLTRLRWKRLAIYVAALATMAYLGLTTTAFLFIRYRRHLNEVHWLDIALPSRWDRYRIAHGNHLVTAARDLAARGQWREALVYSRTGIARSPTNRDGRLLLAQLLLAADRADLAQQTLLDGLLHHRADPAYLQPLFGFLLQRQEDGRVISLARDLLSVSAVDSDPACICALAAATASQLRGKYDQAEDLLHSVSRLATSRDGRLLATRIDWDRGYRTLALIELRTLSAAHGNDPEIHTELVNRLRQAGLADEARRATLAFQIAHPDLAAPRIELLFAYHAAGDTERVAREAEALRRDFPTDAKALLALADFAANTGDFRLARQLMDHARNHQLPWKSHAFLTIEGRLVAKDYRGALDDIRALTTEHVDFAREFQPLLDSLQAVAHLGLGEAETSRVFLASFLGRPALRADNLVALANRFMALDAGEQARQILSRACALDPLNQAALTRLVELDLNLNRIDELPAHLRRLIAMRRPSPDVLRVAQHKLGGDLFLFSAERAPILDAIRLALDSDRPPAPRL